MPYTKRGRWYYRHGKRYSLAQVQAIEASKHRSKAEQTAWRKRRNAHHG